ncbi:cobalamin-binding protein [Pseudomonas tructae]|uniref:Cobalamin-binding protein n=1 Tax=Pseudomonas tructae TaxID=2518644 RepID=A0A411MPH3_9PSED|nr:cobalamin-binding protein [Pseudomonas tructae]QBF28693.1 cobalamin-binding protein [Pseudomonas tructae]
MRRYLWLLLLAFGMPLAAAPRVVSLAPSITEIILDLQAGDLLVGMAEWQERPAQVADVPLVGGYGQLDMERLLSVRPDLVLYWPGSVPAAQRDQLERLGIPLYSVDVHKLDDLVTQVEEIGLRIGRQEQAGQLAAALRKHLAALRQQYRRERPLTVFYQVWDKPLYTVGGTQIISDALSVCGARNVFADLTQPAPQINLETVLARNPAVIFAADQPQLDAWKAWPQIAAVRDGLLLRVPDKGLERPSPQMIEATAKLCALLQAKAPASR